MRKVLVEKGAIGAREFRPGGGATGADTIGPAGGLTPSDLITAYGLPATGGAGQTVAVVEAYNDPNIEADLGVFDTQYGLPACTVASGCLTVVGQTGVTTSLPVNDAIGWSVEETLDVETAHSVCPSCNILVVEANSQSVADLSAAEKTAVRLGATEVSNSFGWPEDQANNAAATAFNHPGIVITASTGDDGYYDYDQLGAISQPSFPASSPNVIAVGGTSLYLGQGGARQSETVWNDNGVQDYWEQNFGVPLGAGGGGCSLIYTAKGWQTHVAGWAQTGCGTHRLDADVSAVADYLTGFDVYDSYSCDNCYPAPGWFTLGGTSLSSPLIASVYALAGGANGIKYPALTLYGHMSALYDVTVGGNGFCDGEGAGQCGDPNLLGFGVLDCDYPASGATPSVGDRACDALVGYDGPTGVGTPKGITAFTKTGPTAVISGPASIVAGTSGTWTAKAKDPFPGGASTMQFVWNWGDGSATTTTAAGSAQHVYATGNANYTIRLTVTDDYDVTGTAATYNVAVPQCGCSG